jgi:hypothetical protein
MLPFEERDALLQSMEKHTAALTEAFETYKRIKNAAVPVSREDGEPDPGEQQRVVALYYEHRNAVEHIIACAGTLKNDIEAVELFFKKGEEERQKLGKHISATLEAYKEKHGRLPRFFSNLSGESADDSSVAPDPEE